MFSTSSYLDATLKPISSPRVKLRSSRGKSCMLRRALISIQCSSVKLRFPNACTIGMVSLYSITSCFNKLKAVLPTILLLLSIYITIFVYLSASLVISSTLMSSKFSFCYLRTKLVHSCKACQSNFLALCISLASSTFSKELIGPVSSVF